MRRGKWNKMTDEQRKEYRANVNRNHINKMFKRLSSKRWIDGGQVGR